MMTASAACAAYFSAVNALSPNADMSPDTLCAAMDGVLQCSPGAADAGKLASVLSHHLESNAPDAFAKALSIKISRLFF